MNVAFVTNVVYPFVKGGAEKRVYELGRRLVARGHDVTVYAREFWDGPETFEYEGMTYRSVAPERKLYTDEGRRSIPEAFEFAGKVLCPVARAVRRGDHDVVVASVFPYFPVLSARAATWFGDAVLVTTWHEVWTDYWEEYLGRLEPFGATVERLVAAIPQYPIAVSNRTAERLADIGPSRESIRVVPNGVDVDAIRSVPPASDEFDVLFAGRLIDDKRVDRLLAAFDRVADRHDATLGVIGDGPESDALREQARDLDNDDRVTFLGFVSDHDDVIAHMQSARTFASASTREGFGIAAVEAMAAGCTVVAVDHPDSAASEVVGDAGVLTDPSVDAIADGLDRVLAGETPASDPEAAAEAYDWDSLACRAERVLTETLDGTTGRA